MDVKQLEAFRTVIDRRSVTAAARVLGLTQPAVSTQIARLEQAVGFTLFERAGRGLKPTPEGVLFYAEACRVLDEFERLTQTTEQIRQGEAGRLVIAGNPWAATALLPDLIARFLADRPGVTVQLITRNSDVISQLLPSQNYDLAIAELPVDSDELMVSRHRLRSVAVLPADHPAAKRQVLTPAHMARHPMVAPARTRIDLRARIASAFVQAGVLPRIVVEAEVTAAICAMVATGLGWALVDPLSARRHRHLGLVVRAFQPAIDYRFGVFSRRDREPSRLAAAFTEMLEAEVQRFSGDEPELLQGDLRS